MVPTWASEGESNAGQAVDALALGADEGRRRRRNVLGSCQQAVIQDYPNGATRSRSYGSTSPSGEAGTGGTETSQYPVEEKSPRFRQ